MDELSAKRLATVLFDTDESSAMSGFPDIPGYAIHELLGQGGGGDVYGGTVESTGRPVAVKLLHAHAGLNAQDAFRELDRLAAVRSSVVPHVLDYGYHNDQIYIVTEYIRGQDPLTYAAGLSLNQRVQLFADIADAVSKLHARGVLHRDIKPSNVLVTEDGTPVILDLGISSLATDSSDAQDGVVQGTACYMCPEQAAGQNSESTTGWDVYALGVMGVEILLSKRFDPHTAREHLLHGIPKRLQSILRAAIAKSPEERYETAQLLRDDLEAWLRREPTYVERTHWWPRIFRLLSARPILTVSIVSLLIILSSVSASMLLNFWLSTKPYRFETIADSGGQSLLSLYSRNGTLLHEWTVDGSYRIQMNNRIVRKDGIDFAVIGLGSADIDSGREGLMVYESGQWDAPLWIAQQDVTPEMAHVTRFEEPPHTFRYLDHYFFDVFPSVVGTEIVSLHRHVPSSLCAVQIHSIEGELLSEYYHDGWITTAAWLAQQNQLVLAGQNSDGTWEARGAKEIPAGKYPIVIFAITPELGSTGNTIAHPGLGVGEPADWYKCLTPPEAYDPLCTETIGPLHHVRISHQPELAEQGVVAWQLGENLGKDEQGHATLEIDTRGQIINAWSTDNWNGEKDYDLTPGIYQLENLPPRNEARDYEPLKPPVSEP